MRILTQFHNSFNNHCRENQHRDRGIHVKIEDVIRMSTCKTRRNYKEAKRSVRTAIGSSVNLKQENSVHSLAVVSNMEGFVRDAEVCNGVLQ